MLALYSLKSLLFQAIIPLRLQNRTVTRNTYPEWGVACGCSIQHSSPLLSSSALGQRKNNSPGTTFLTALKVKFSLNFLVKIRAFFSNFLLFKITCLTEITKTLRIFRFTHGTEYRSVCLNNNSFIYFYFRHYQEFSRIIVQMVRAKSFYWLECDALYQC